MFLSTVPEPTSYGPLQADRVHGASVMLHLHFPDVFPQVPIFDPCWQHDDGLPEPLAGAGTNVSCLCAE